MLVGDVAIEFMNSTIPATISAIPAQHLFRNDVSFVNAGLQAFFMVSVAEVFDKTWFMAIIMAMTFGKQVSFWASTLALQAHVVIAAIFGLMLAKLISPLTLLILASILYFVFFALYAWDCLNADKDSDIFAAGMEESREDAGLDAGGGDGGDSKTAAKYGSTGGSKTSTKNTWAGFWKTFIAVFIAEWGDRTQIAMIGQHASLPIIPVVIGSAIAFTLLTASAVIVSGFVDSLKISERDVNCLAACSFLLFCLLTVNEIMVDLGKGPQDIVHMLSR